MRLQSHSWDASLIPALHWCRKHSWEVSFKITLSWMVAIDCAKLIVFWDPCWKRHLVIMSCQSINHYLPDYHQLMLFILSAINMALLNQFEKEFSGFNSWLVRILLRINFWCNTWLFILTRCADTWFSVCLSSIGLTHQGKQNPKDRCCKMLLKQPVVDCMKYCLWLFCPEPCRWWNLPLVCKIFACTLLNYRLRHEHHQK